MLIRWATEEERKEFSYPKEKYGDYEVVVAINRMKNSVLGIIGFTQETRIIEDARILDPAREGEIKEKLLLCADRQCNPKGKSFHYRYQKFIREAQKEHCPVCNNEPAPDGQNDIEVSDIVWICGEYPGQGRLFGKMYVMPRNHAFHFEDMTEYDMINYMREVQRVGKALRKVTGAEKINYEMHSNSGAHLHIHLCPRYLDDDFPGKAIDLSCPSDPVPYESYDEYLWFIDQMTKELMNTTA